MKSHHSSLRRANLYCLLILTLGSLQMLGFVLNSKALRGIGAASAASPFPKVFCTAPVHGESGAELEAFSAQFTLLHETGGRTVETVITPEIYHRLKGPYNRRNVYGAALAYGPCLPPELVQQTLGFALLEPGTLVGELGLPPGSTNLRVRIDGRVDGEPRSWELSPSTQSLP